MTKPLQSETRDEYNTRLHRRALALMPLWQAAHGQTLTGPERWRASITIRETLRDTDPFTGNDDEHIAAALAVLTTLDPRSPRAPRTFRRGWHTMQISYDEACAYHELKALARTADAKKYEAVAHRLRHVTTMMGDAVDHENS